MDHLTCKVAIFLLTFAAVFSLFIGYSAYEGLFISGHISWIAFLARGVLSALVIASATAWAIPSKVFHAHRTAPEKQDTGGLAELS